MRHKRNEFQPPDSPNHNYLDCETTLIHHRPEFKGTCNTSGNKIKLTHQTHPLLPVIYTIKYPPTQSTTGKENIRQNDGLQTNPIPTHLQNSHIPHDTPSIYPRSPKREQSDSKNKTPTTTRGHRKTPTHSVDTTRSSNEYSLSWTTANGTRKTHRA